MAITALQQHHTCRQKAAEYFPALTIWLSKQPISSGNVLLITEKRECVRRIAH